MYLPSVLKVKFSPVIKPFLSRKHNFDIKEFSTGASFNFWLMVLIFLKITGDGKYIEI